MPASLVTVFLPYLDLGVIADRGRQLCPGASQANAGVRAQPCRTLDSEAGAHILLLLTHTLPPRQASSNLSFPPLRANRSGRHVSEQEHQGLECNKEELPFGTCLVVSN